MNDIDNISQISWVLEGKKGNLPENNLSKTTLDNAFFRVRILNGINYFFSKFAESKYKPIEKWWLFKYQFNSNGVELTNKDTSNIYRSSCLFLKNTTLYCDSYYSIIKIIFKETDYSYVVKLLQVLDSLKNGYYFKSAFENCYNKETKFNNEADLISYLNYLITNFNKNIIVLNNSALPEIILNPLKSHLLLKKELFLINDNDGNLFLDKKYNFL